jgi:WD40 repeat protein
VSSSARTTYSGHGSSVTSVAWGTSGLASGSADTDIIIWQV